MARRQPELPPPLRCFTYASSDVPGSYVRVQGRRPKTKRDRDALEAIIAAAYRMLEEKKP